MQLLRRPLIAAAMLACLCAAPPIAAKPAPMPKLITETAKPVVVRGTPLGTLADCELGVGLVGGVYLLDGYIQPPGDQYYTLIDPGECATCSDTVLIAAAHIVLLLTTGCTRQPIDVSIVGVSPDDSACPKPDPSNVILPAAPYVLDYGTSGLLDFEIPLLASVCITGRVFLGFTFQEVECYSPLVVQEGGKRSVQVLEFLRIQRGRSRHRATQVEPVLRLARPLRGSLVRLVRIDARPAGLVGVAQDPLRESLRSSL